jgi:DNA-directed RNA polymerase specialized sigma24 family protein
MLYDANVEQDQLEGTIPPWRKAPDTAETQVLRKLDDETIRRLVAALPDVFHEVVVLCEIDDLSYREIATIVSAPVVTVMSRLARGRAMLCEAWLKAGHYDEQKKEPPGESEKQLELLYEGAHIDTVAGTRSSCT